MKRKIVILLALVAGLLGGCNANELEDRCFPLLALVDYDARQEEASFSYTFPSPRREEDKGTATGDLDAGFAYGETFQKAWEYYEKKLDKEADYNHLKVVALGEDFVGNADEYNKMLDFLQEKETFPRNAYVCVIRETEELIEIEGSLSDDAGTYLESFLKNHEYGKTDKLVTLGSLMDEQENRRKELALPYITVEDGSVLWEAHYLIDKGVPAGICP